MINVENLTIGYEGKPVSENISFNVKEGDYLCIVGENGAGKSTLVKTILGLQKPMSGKITFDEKGIGYLPQQTPVQKDFPASVWEIVMSGNLPSLGHRPFYRSEHHIRAEENMKKMGIWELRKSCYRDLSGGQQQRVLLARALCTSRQVLFLDEPATGLDPKVSAEFYGLTRELNSKGVTIIMVSHDMDTVLECASHILHIGRNSVFFGTLKEYIGSEESKELYVKERK